MRERLEHYQVFLYLAAILAGLWLGTSSPALASGLDAALWPLLGLLLYATFTQVPLVRLRRGLAQGRFLAAAVLGNFAVIPLVVWGLVQWLPDDPALRLGVLLVLLVPCTDWFLPFTYLGRGDLPTAIAFTPVSLLLQLVLLPLYLWLFLGQAGLAGLLQRELLMAFGGLILLPLAAAFFTERWVNRAPRRLGLIAGLGWLPVPLLALVLLVITAAQAPQLAEAPRLLALLTPIFVVFLAAAALLALILARLLALPVAQGRVLAFSFGSRNSFVVLPLALALPAGMEAAVIVVVFQSLVELFGMLIFLWLIPRVLFADRA